MGNKIGGSVNGAGNTIVNNGGNGILVESSPGAPRQLGSGGPTVIEGNNIGVTFHAMTGNILRMGNALIGVLVKDTSGVKIGGINVGNAIGANVGAGIKIEGEGAKFVEVIGNLLGSVKNLQGQLLDGGGNGGDGIQLIGAGVGNKIGGSVNGGGNTIVNNGGNGILVESSPGAPRQLGSGEPTVIEGNNIGVTFHAMTGNILRMGNALIGVLVKDTSGVKIGGINVGNAIGANVGAGIKIEGEGAKFVEVIGNLLGSVKNLQGQLLDGGGNGGDGVQLIGAGVGNKIGGSVNGAGNTIVNNGGNGILVESSPGAPRQLGSGEPTVIEGNNIGVTFHAMTGNILRMGNALIGVLVKDTSGVKIGGINVGNAIGANVGAGIKLEGEGAKFVEVIGNLLGSVKNLQGQLLDGGGNGGDGVQLIGAGVGNKIGGSVNGGGNTIVNNGGNGILVESSPGAPRQLGSGEPTVIEGNNIGVTFHAMTGSILRMGNALIGVLVKNTNGVKIGGINAGNAIGANVRAGIEIEGEGAEFVEVIGNLIGSMKNLQGQLLNGGGNGGHGVRINGAPRNRVGANTAAQANVIVSNFVNGIVINGPTAVDNTVEGNLIGVESPPVGGRTRQAGSAYGNGSHGILLENGTRGNTIGGTTTASGSVIANNGGNGIHLASTAGSGNRIGTNSIYGNTLPGIDLGGNGFTPNDPTDADVGPNNLQNYPNIVSFAITGDNLIVNYQVDSAPAHSSYGSTGIYVEFFEADASGEGRDFLGSDHYLLSDYNNGLPGTRQKNLGNAAALGFVAGDRLTATATDTAGNSSEFTPALAGIVAISGRVSTPTGLGLRNAIVSLTDSLGVRRTATTSSFGVYSFDNVRAGETYVISVASKRYRFASRSLEINANLSNVDFVGLE